MLELLERRSETDGVVREIELHLRDLLEARSASGAAYGPHFDRLWRLGSECLLGGKLLRPCLLMGAFDALAREPGGDAARRPAALRIAAAVELLHFSFLLHDDVIDEDLLRRGAPNVIGRVIDASRAESGVEADDASERSLHWARSSGILLGDMMLSAAHQVFAREALPEAVRVRLLDLLDRTITESVAGEQYDVGLSDGVIPADLDAVLEMSRLKTATYTFELPLRAAAVLAGAEPRVEQALGEVARHLGVAFQLQDDLLCAFGDSREHGKDAFSDFREGKKTAIIAYARMTDAWPTLEPLLGAPGFTEEHGRAIRAALVQCGAEGFIGSMVDDRIRAAVEIASREATVIPEGLSRFLLRVVDTLEGRRA